MHEGKHGILDGVEDLDDVCGTKSKKVEDKNKKQDPKHDDKKPNKNKK